MREKIVRKQAQLYVLVKSLIHAKADIIPDNNNKTLTVAIYSLTYNRDNQAVYKIFATLNQTETVFPNSNLEMIFKYATG